MRKRLYEIIEVSKEGDRASFFYDLFMLSIIVVSIAPMTLRDAPSLFLYTEIFTTIIFTADYILRFITADFKLGRRSFTVFFQYPFTPWAIIDLLSILPAITMLNKSFLLLRLFRALKMLRVVRVLKFFRYTRSLNLVFRIIAKSKDVLLAVCIMAFGYIFVCALIIFNVESEENLPSFFDAIYYTTMGYEDFHPTTKVGRIVAMSSEFVGMVFIALPASIIMAEYIDFLKHDRENEVEQKKEDSDRL